MIRLLLGFEVAELAFAHRVGNRRHLRLELGIDAADDGAAHRRRPAQHRIGIEKRRRTRKPRRTLQLLHARAPIADRRPACVQAGVRGKLSRRVRNSDSRPFMTDRTVIRCGHAQRDPDQRDPGDERHEKAVFAGQRIAQAHEYGNGLEHARRLNHK